MNEEEKAYSPEGRSIMGELAFLEERVHRSLKTIRQRLEALEASPYLAAKALTDDVVKEMPLDQ